MRLELRNRRNSLICAGLLVLTISSGTNGAAQVKEMTPAQLVERSEVVAVGKVTRMKAEWTPNKTRIVTRVEVAVDEYLKGNTGGTITILSPGGEIDGVGEWYSHTARFTKDEDVVVFAQKDKKGEFHVAGGNQGKLSISKQEKTGLARVSDKTTLDDLKAQIKRAVGPQEIK